MPLFLEDADATEALEDVLSDGCTGVGRTDREERSHLELAVADRLLLLERLLARERDEPPRQLDFDRRLLPSGSIFSSSAEFPFFLRLLRFFRVRSRKKKPK